jgi:hypothetical protein
LNRMIRRLQVFVLINLQQTMHFMWDKKKTKSHLQATVIHVESTWKTKIESRRYHHSVFQITSVLLQVCGGTKLICLISHMSISSQCIYIKVCPRKTRSFHKIYCKDSMYSMFEYK